MTILIRSVILNHWSQKQDYLETKQRWKGSGLSILSKSLSLIPVWHHLAQCPLTLCGRPCHCCHGDVWTCTGLEGRTAWWWGGGYRQQQTTLGRHPEAWAQGKQPSLIPVGLLSWGDTAAVSNPTEDMRWRFSVFAGGQLPDSHKPGTDGVGLSGKGPEEASWTVAERGDCLSAQALGHTATPRWARAPALGFQRDVFGGGTGFPLSLQDPKDSPPPSPQTVSYSHSLSQPPKCSSNSFSPSAMDPLTLCYSHHCLLTFWRKKGEGWAAALHPSAPCLSMLWTMMLQHGSLGAIKTLASGLRPSTKPPFVLCASHRCPPSDCKTHTSIFWVRHEKEARQMY